MPDEKDAKTAKTQKKKPVFDVVIRKDFKSVEEVASTFKLHKSHEWSKMKVKYSLEKKFRWFYTYYTYKEMYPKIDTKFKNPIDSFMTKDEVFHRDSKHL